jgi:DNA invertase Pin-like site-specific DNA recombinase
LVKDSVRRYTVFDTGGSGIAKHSSKWVSYLRVSTDKQGASGLGLEAQRKAVADYLNGGKWMLAREFVEIESGKRNDRPKLAEALALCKKLKAKLIVAKLDRLGRNVHFLSGLMESGVDFVAVDQPFANKLTIHILAAVAEHEREMISTRTRDALAAAKARGVKLGGPKLAEACRIGHRTQAEQADRFAANTRPVIEQIRKSGITSLRAIAAALNARGVPTARGGTWTPVQIMAIERRATGHGE